MRDVDDRYVVPGGAGAQEARTPGAAPSSTARPQQPALHLDWAHGPGGAPWRLAEISLGRLAPRGLAGVFLVWFVTAHDMDAPCWVYVGESGDVGSRLVSMGGDTRLKSQRDGGHLLVSWAPVASLNRRGVTCFLDRVLGPVVPERHEIDSPIPVNLPA